MTLLLPVPGEVKWAPPEDARDHTEIGRYLVWLATQHCLELAGDDDLPGRFPDVWRHGDWIRFTERGSCAITGRSDAILNRGGVRLGTAEFYRLVEELPEVSESLVVHLEDPLGGQGELILFVVTRDGLELDDELRQLIASTLRSALSPWHIPDTLLAVGSVPRNLTGKKLELPIKRILLGEDVDDVVSPDALAHPSALDSFLKEARERAHRGQG